MALGMLAVVLSLSTTRHFAFADTVILKDGNQINDCQVTSETETHVFLKTKSGPMGVPKSEILRLLKQKSVFDLYAERRAEVNDKDIGGLFQLALWCRRTDGLRGKSDELVREVLALNENHTKARKLAGHLRIDGEWVEPPPLAIRLRSDGTHDAKIRTNLEAFLRQRGDVVLARETGGAADGVNVVGLSVSLSISRSTGTRFYGVSLGGPSLAATLLFSAQSDWLGRKPVKTSVDGFVPLSGGSAEQAINSAFGSNGMFIHKYLDRIVARRMTALRRELREKRRSEKKSTRKSTASSP